MNNKKKPSVVKSIFYCIFIFVLFQINPVLAAVVLVGTGATMIARGVQGGNGQQQLPEPTPMRMLPPVEPVSPPKTLREKAEAAGVQSRFNQQANEYLSRLRKYAMSIRNPKVTVPLSNICSDMEKALKVTREQPEKRKSTETFLRNYIPAIQKLLRQYSEIERNGLDSKMEPFCEKMEKFMADANTAFDNHLQSLFTEDLLDASAEMSMMQSMLRAEGLIGDDPFDDQDDP